MVVLTRKEIEMNAKSTAASVTLALLSNFAEGEGGTPYLIRRDGEILAVSNMPAFTVSEPITNSFVYIDGEYIPPPYVVSASNLAVCINGRVIRDAEPWVKIPPKTHTHRVGITTESVGHSIDSSCESLVESLKKGGVSKFYWGGQRSAGGGDDDGGALALVELARKAAKGDEQARRALVQEMGLENSLSKVRPDWIQRLAGNTNLEARATRILEAKRQREQHERERRERMERQDGHGNPRPDGNAHQ
jgi:hypothetical protein